jgi:hypothetical protein
LEITLSTEKNNAALYRRIDEVIHYLWDPIGVSDIPEARDEYNSYLSDVEKMLSENSSLNELTDYLLYIETVKMGLPGDIERANKISRILLSWKIYFNNQSAN